jgi:hypothetical protein
VLGVRVRAAMTETRAADARPRPQPPLAEPASPLSPLSPTPQLQQRPQQPSPPPRPPPADSV